MKKIVTAVLIFATIFTSCKENKKTKKETKILNKINKSSNVDITNSIVHWKGTKLGGAHFGEVSLKLGFLKIINGQVKSGEFIIDMNSIVDTDMPVENKYNAKLVRHLKGKDFFDVTMYPIAKFVISSVENKKNKFFITGNLTLKNVTKSITIPVSISKKKQFILFKSEHFKINRADFNITYKSKTFFNNLKDKFIGDLIEISFEISIKK